MSFYTRPNFEDRQQVQYSGDTITLSGKTHINTTGYLKINAPILDWTGSTSASTQYNIAGINGYINYGELSSFIVQPPIIIQSGTTGTTTVDVTGYFLGGLDADGRVTWLQAPTGSGGTIIISGGTDNYVTGGTYSNGILILNRQNGNVSITGFTTGNTTTIQFTGNTSASCITDLYVQRLNSCSPLYIQDISGGDVIISPFNNGNIAIGHISASTKLDVSGKTKTTEFQLTNGAVNGYVLTSDSIGNATWQPAPSGSGGTIVISGGTISPYKFGSNIYDIVTLSGNNFTLSNQSLVLGGISNIADGIGSTIINGQYNTLSGGTGTTIINGSLHLISNSEGAMVGNGFLNTIKKSIYGSIINGDNNLIDGSILTSNYSFIGGGSNNFIDNSTRSFIGNGNNNTISVFGTIGIGNSILNGSDNLISTSVVHSSIVGGQNNKSYFSYSSIIGGQDNLSLAINSFILGSSITATSINTTYTENLIAGANAANSYVGHLSVNNNNTVGPIRPNYITELLHSGNTTGGTYNITIPINWVVEDVQVYVKTVDTNVFGATIGTSAGIWVPTTPTPFVPNHNIITLFRTVAENGPHFFSSSDLATVYFVDAGASPIALTNGEYKVLITYWDGGEAGIF